ncbi:uncharacterized protein LOC134822952 isoform X2 [Bolinopsis microptera]|uniref:uncharacterized protein LOC134822952 isoform X2 n=1 Tax=Bolinopsis microptera TaxID=2820187 RepID=UPI00307A7559
MSYNYLWTVLLLVANGFARDLTRDCLNNPAPILNDFQTTILLLHNAARGKHEETPPLCWSHNIADDAQTHADTLVDPEGNPDGRHENKSNYRVQDDSGYPGQTQQLRRYGENIYRAKILFAGMSDSEVEMARGAIQSWYNEEPIYNYKFELGAYSDSTKKFTQMIWRSSTHIGCAYSVRQSHYYFVVCMYTPDGNKGGKSGFHDNVRKKIACDAPVIYKGKHTTTGPFLLDQTVTVRCDSGYHLEGSRTGTCVKNETFAFEVEPRCTGCEVADIANGTVSRDVGSVVADKDTVMYSCNEGYSLDNAARVLQCDGNDFVHDVPKCRKEGYCLRPNIENGIAYARSIDDDFGMRGEEQGWDHNIPDGHNISIICGAGYELVGNDTAVCRGEKFDGGVGSCELCYIKDAKSIYNRYINVYTGIVHDRPPTCFGPNTEAISSECSLRFPSYWLLIILLTSHILALVT